MKAVVAAFNQEKALVGAFSVIVQLRRLIVNSSTEDVLRPRHRDQDAQPAQEELPHHQQQPRPQVGCDWWRAGHVTTVVSCDWSAGSADRTSMTSPRAATRRRTSTVAAPRTSSSSPACCRWSAPIVTSIFTIFRDACRQNHHQSPMGGLICRDP